MVPSVADFEKLGAFYLGRKYDLASGDLQDDLLLYDSKDLCTHALCVGMTGSGKTGLCLSLLEEAAIDQIPIICVDPKGDLANLKLTFPDLRPADFEPWLEASEATRQGKTVTELANDTAKLWKEGLAKWGQGPDRVRALRDAAEVSIYTPGSTIGIPLTVLRSFDAPQAAVLDDSEAMRERVTGAASGLLTLLGVDADPLLSREHILVSTILDQSWREGRSVSIAEMIGLIQTPPFKKVGVLDLESFMPLGDRAALAMRLNNLLASPAFASWLEGESLDIQRLLYTQEGRPRISILSIAHLNDSERMFFVTILLNELVAWMRAQSGTSSLRAIFYMDEVFGYFPPTAKPPSKPPMLTLLKQARAFGLGITLATQNPVDLDYKGLSNIGTWFLGRLQTERDKQRVLEGLEGAAAQTGQPFNRQKMEETLAALGKRVFLMNNVHEDGPQTFQTRWAMSYLAGPLARDQIGRLTEAQKAGSKDGQAEALEKVDVTAPAAARPVAPAGVNEFFFPARRIVDDAAKLIYRPAVLGKASLHYVRSSADLDAWYDHAWLVLCGKQVPEPLWLDSQVLSPKCKLLDSPEDGFEFNELPPELCNADHFDGWAKTLKDYCYRRFPLTLYKSTALKEYAPPGVSEQEARVNFTQQAREARDRETEKLRAKYASKMATLDRRIRSAEERLAREKDQLKAASVSSMINLGQSLLGALMGNKLASRTNVSRAGTVMRGAQRTSRQQGDVRRAEASLQELSVDMLDLDAKLRNEIIKVTEKYAVANLELEAVDVAPRKGDLKVHDVMLAWTPWQVDADGIADPLFEVE